MILDRQHLFHLQGWQHANCQTVVYPKKRSAADVTWLPKIRILENASHLTCEILWENVVLRATVLMARRRRTHAAAAQCLLSWEESQAD